MGKISLLIKIMMYLFILAVTIKYVNSARILDEVDLHQPLPHPFDPIDNSGLPSGQFPAVAPSIADTPIIVAPKTTLDDDNSTPVSNPSINAGLVPGLSPTATQVGVTSANSGTQARATRLSFFMHDIVGGSNPSSRTVTGIIAKTEVNGIPFSKSSNNFFPLTGGTPLLTGNNLNNIVNTQNLPFLTGLNGARSTTVLQNTGNNNIVNGGNNQPFVTAGQLPAGTSLQQLMFGSITVIDDELTEGHELGSTILGRAQGFYLASSLDGTSQSIALTILLHGVEHETIEDTISFFGVHRTASPESQVAIVGGTGKYENARGYATLETMQLEDQHITDGVDTILHFDVFFT
ncbi:hypothetical protein ACFE04_008451 [Oxalis oulophora]